MGTAHAGEVSWARGGLFGLMAKAVEFWASSQLKLECAVLAVPVCRALCTQGF